MCSNILFSNPQFSGMQGEFSMQRFSNTSFGRTLLGSNFGGLLLEQAFCRHFAVAFPLSWAKLALKHSHRHSTMTKRSTLALDCPNRLRRPPSQGVLEKPSAVPKHGRSKRGQTQKHANAHKRAQMSAKEPKRKSAKGRKRAQKSAST